MRTSGILLLFMLPLCGPASAAEIYRCVGERGEPSFSHTACGSRSIAIGGGSKSDAVPGSGLRPGERAWLAERASRSSSPREPASIEGQDSRRQKAVRQAYQCTRRRQALDAVKAELRRGYRPAKGERLRRRRRAHEDYLAAFCP